MDQNHVGRGRNVEIFDDFGGFQQGRYSVGSYCHYSRSHTSMFRSANVKACLIWALLFSVVYQVIDSLEQSKVSRQSLSRRESEYEIGQDGMAVSGLKKNGPVNQNLANQTANESQGETLKNIPVNGGNEEMSEKVEEEGKYILFRMFYGFLRCYLLAFIYTFSVVYLIPALLGMILDVLMRHVVAKSKGYLMLQGLYRIRRVRSNR